MTLEEAIIHAEKIAEVELDARSYALEWRDNEEAEKCQKCADEHRQLAEWLKELSRARTLLKATHELLESAKKSPYVLDTLRIVVHYDEADCDGNCLKEDIENYLNSCIRE